MADSFLSSDLISWYNRINTVRTQAGMGLTALPLPSVSTNTLASASVITTFKDQILAMKSNTYMAYADYTSTNNISASSGSLISKTLKTNIETSVSEMEKICSNNTTTGNSTQSTNTTWSTYSQDTTQQVSNDRTCTTDSTNSTNITDTCKTTYNVTYGDRLTCPVGTQSTQPDYSTLGDYTNSTLTTKTTTSCSTDKTNSNYSDGCSTYTDTTNSTNKTDTTTSNSTYTVKK